MSEHEYRVNFSTVAAQFEYVVFAETESDAISEAKVSAREDGWNGRGVITAERLS